MQAPAAKVYKTDHSISWPGFFFFRQRASKSHQAKIQSDHGVFILTASGAWQAIVAISSCILQSQQQSSIVESKMLSHISDGVV